MKNILRKTVAIAVIACFMLAAIPALAADPEIVPQANVTGNTVDLTVISLDLEGTATELTVLVVSCGHSEDLVTNPATGEDYCPTCSLEDENLENNIVYINQVTSTGDIFTSFPSFTLNGGKYTAFFGGEGIENPVALTFTIEGGAQPRTILYGDVDGDNDLTAQDLMKLVQHTANIVSLVGDRVLAADLDSDEVLTSQDLMKLAQQQANVIEESSFPNGGVVPSGAKVYTNSTKTEILAQY